MKPRMREQMRLGTQRRRHGVFMTTLAWTAGLVALLPLVLILTHLIVHGLGQITPRSSQVCRLHLGCVEVVSPMASSVRRCW